ncbi:unnamed protein product, partial [Sphacelaria rigidula]
DAFDATGHPASDSGMYGAAMPGTGLHGFGSTLVNSNAFVAPPPPLPPQQQQLQHQYGASIPWGVAPDLGTSNPAWKMTLASNPSDVPGHPATMLMSICAMAEYQSWSYEELRVQDYLRNRKSNWVRRGYQYVRHGVSQ